jgi:hypothetical protein
MSEDDPFQKMELSLEEAFERRFDKMAAIRRKMSLGMGDLDGGAHETKGMAICSIDQLFWHIGTEKTDRRSIFGKMRNDFPITQRGDHFDLF